jgi:hypothetical protein
MAGTPVVMLNVPPEFVYDTSSGIYAVITQFNMQLGVTDVVVPDTYEGLPVVDFGQVFAGKAITSITFGANITQFVEGAFSGCTDLTGVNLPEGLTSIQGYMFTGCTSLTEITIPSTVTFVGGYAFQDCTSLQSVWFNSTEPMEGGYIFDGLTPDSVMVYAPSWATWNSTFGGMPVIPYDIDPFTYDISSGTEAIVTGYDFVHGPMDVVVPDTYVGLPVTGVGTLFQGSGITSFTGGANLSYLAGGAFWLCTSLTSATFPASLTSLNGSTFDDCASLTAVYWAGNEPSSPWNEFTSVWPINVTMYVQEGSSWNSTFWDKPVVVQEPPSFFTFDISSGYEAIITGYDFVNGPTDVVIPDTRSGLPVTSYGYTFMGSGITSVSGGANIINITGGAFSSCLSLISVSIPDTVIGTIQGNAFSDCTSLSSVTMGSGVTAIESYAFYQCTALTSITIGPSVASIGEYAFAGSGLTALTIPDNVTYLAQYMTKYADYLGSIDIGTGVGEVGEGAFSGYALTTLNFAGNAPYSSLNNSIEYPAQVTCYVQYGTWGWSSTFDGANVVVQNAPIWTYTLDGENNATMTSYDFNAGGNDVVVPSTIDGYTVIDFGNTLNNGGMGSSITSLVVPDSVTMLAPDALNSCGSLTTVTLGAGITSIPYGAFYNCASLSSVTLGSGVTSIDFVAFFGTALTTIDIPASLTDLSWDVFGYCYSLTSVRFLGNSPLSEYDIFVGLTPGSVTVYVQYGTTGWGETFWTMPVVWEGTPPDPFTYYIDEGNGVAYIESYSFALGGTDVVIPDTYNGYPIVSFNNVFSSTGVGSEITSLTGGANLQYLAEDALANCTALHTVTLPEGLTVINNRAFRACSSLTSVSLPSTLTSLGVGYDSWYGVFEGCSSLVSLSIPSGVTTLYGKTFDYCYSLSSVTWAGNEPTSSYPTTTDFYDIYPNMYVSFGSTWADTFQGLAVIGNEALTFDLQGGTGDTPTWQLVNDQPYSYGNSGSFPADPTLDSYIFSGWYTEPYGFGSLIAYDTYYLGTMSVTLYAHWTQ